MSELMNCPNCSSLFIKTNLRDVCEQCYKNEEKAYDTVYSFLRRKNNRSAGLSEIVKETGVEDKLIYKFIRNGRIQLSNFPNLGYPCQKCGNLIREGKLCSSCGTDLLKQVSKLEKEEEHSQQLLQKEKSQTFFVK